jgi:hypothetical protein
MREIKFKLWIIESRPDTYGRVECTVLKCPVNILSLMRIALNTTRKIKKTEDQRDYKCDTLIRKASCIHIVVSDLFDFPLLRGVSIARGDNPSLYSAVWYLAVYRLWMIIGVQSVMDAVSVIAEQNNPPQDLYTTSILVT